MCGKSLYDIMYSPILIQGCTYMDENSYHLPLHCCRGSHIVWVFMLPPTWNTVHAHMTCDIPPAILYHGLYCNYKLIKCTYTVNRGQYLLIAGCDLVLICAYTHTYTHTYIHTHTHTYTHTYTHTHTHIHTQTHTNAHS